MKTASTLALATVMLAAAGCLNVRTHSSFDPLYVNLDINLRVQLQKELADVFGEIDAASNTVNANE